MQTRGATKKAAMACSSSGAAKRTRRATTCCIADAGSREGEEEETTMTFSMDRDVLNCRVCFVPFEAQVYMCKNGHGACANCCIRTNRKCGCCCEPIGDLRNRHLESFLAAMTTPCRFARYGCDESVSYTEKRRHEETCAYEPYDCPFDGCGHRGLELYDHVRDEHAPAANPASAVIISYQRRGSTVTLRKAEPFLVLVQPGRERVFVLRNGGDVLEGRSLSLVFLGPRRTEEEDDVELQYTMEVTGAGGPGALAQLSASGTVPCARRLEGFQAKGFLFVPDAYWGAAGQVSVRVRV